MSEKFKKSGRQFVLSDSSLNVYGFRLLTSGYQLESFQKNPIGYYMHRREDGIALKWDDLRIEGDTIVGTPVINLSNQRGDQTFDEIEHGFLNAASVGHIVVLEYSNDPSMMLPGQTGPTITKWYNKECSLVDIPGNCNALTNLYDAQENALMLPDLMATGSLPFTGLSDTIKKGLLLDATATTAEAEQALMVLLDKHQKNEAELQQLRDNKEQLEREVAAQKAEQSKNKVNSILAKALEDRKITVAVQQRLAADYAQNPEGLLQLVSALPEYKSITENIRLSAQNNFANWSWDDFEKNDPTGKHLNELRASDPAKYQFIFEAKFGATKK